MAHSVMADMEDELSRLFVGTKKEVFRKGNERRNKKEYSFVKEVHGLTDADRRMYRTRKNCVSSYLINLGEMAILKRRIESMRILRSWFNDLHRVLKDIIDLRNNTIIHIMKFIAKSIGFIHPADVLNRVVTLRSLKTESLKEQEELDDRYSRMNEAHLQVKNTLGKENLLMNNKRHELDNVLFDKQTEVTELHKVLAEAMSSSCDESRMIFQITNQIDNIHDSLTSARGYTSTAKTVFEKLDEINVRAEVLKKTVKSICASINSANLNINHPVNEIDATWHNNDMANNATSPGTLYVKETTAPSYSSSYTDTDVRGIKKSNKMEGIALSGNCQWEIFDGRSDHTNTSTGEASDSSDDLSRRNVSFCSGECRETHEIPRGKRHGDDGSSWVDNVVRSAPGRIDSFASQNCSFSHINTQENGDDGRSRDTKTRRKTVAKKDKTPRLPKISGAGSKMCTTPKDTQLNLQKILRGLDEAPLVLPPMTPRTPGFNNRLNTNDVI